MTYTNLILMLTNTTIENILRLETRLKITKLL